MVGKPKESILNANQSSHSDPPRVRTGHGAKRDGCGSKYRMRINRPKTVSPASTPCWLGGLLLLSLPFPLNYQVLFIIGFVASMMSQWHVMRVCVPDRRSSLKTTPARGEAMLSMRRRLSPLRWLR